jgi:hypothetical protein
MSAADFESYRIKRSRGLPPGWAIADIQLLRNLSMQGLTVGAIANALGRTESAVRNKAQMHGISLQSKRLGTRRTG